MASNWLYIDTAFPSFTGEESVNEKIATIQNYMFMLVEQLRYTLHNLDLTNMNTTAVEQFTGSITEPIYGRIEDDEGNVAQLQVTATTLASQIADANGNISTLQQTATSLTSRVSSAEGNISTLQQTATSLTSQIATANGNISTLQQTANSLTATVEDLDEGMATKLELNSKGLIVSGNGGSVTINGGNIDADTIHVNAANVSGMLLADYISFKGMIVVRDENGVLRGTIGAMKGTYPGAALCSVDGDYVIATTGGARLHSGTYDIWVAEGSGCYSSSQMSVYSDKRLKTDIDYDMTRYEELFLRMKPAHYLMKAEGESGKRHIGMIADDVKETAEEIGLPLSDLALLQEFDGMLSLSYGEMISMLLYMIQKINKRLDELEGAA